MKEERLKISKMLKEKDIDDKLEMYLSPDLYCYIHNYIVDIKIQIDKLQQENARLKEIENKLNFIKNRKNQGASQENINKMAIEFVNSYLKEVLK